MRFINTKYFKMISSILLCFILSSCISQTTSKQFINHNPKYSTKELLVHFVDVGQGDSTLIQINNKNLLIDGGPSVNSENLVRYLRDQGVKKLDLIIATHPHEDHIGGLPSIIDNFSVESFYAPRKTADTEAFENLVRALKDKNLKINVAKAQMSLDLGDNVLINLISPLFSDYEDINDYSVVLTLNFNSSRFIFMGDSEKLVENQLLEKGYDVSADVIKIGHHGSNSSSSNEFINKVSPQYAVISSGRENDYGHPHKETIDLLQKKNIKVYRTDLNNTIVFRSNGKNIFRE
jgi:competence protein ComEC